jgi:hypothetical protein
MAAPDIMAWHDFFVTIAQVGATLAGLLFVGLTISLSHLLQGRGYLNRAFTALFLQFETLVIGLCGLIPGQPMYVLGIEFAATGLLFLMGIRIFAHHFREDENSAVLGSLGPRAVRATLAYIATLFPVICGALLILNVRGALYWLMPAEIACLYLSIGNAWVFAVEIPRRQAQKNDQT